MFRFMRSPLAPEVTITEPAWLAFLAEVQLRHPWERKVLVCARRAVGHEALRRLSLESGGWANFNVTTPSGLAVDIAKTQLSRVEEALGDEFDEAERIDFSIDEALAESGGESLLDWVEGTGLREAMANSVRALRLAGIGAAELGRVVFRDQARQKAIGRVLEQYERRLYNERRIDRAGVLRHAIESLRVGTAPLPEGRYFVFPGVSGRGLSGALVDLLQERGAQLVPSDPVHGLTRPAALVPSPSPGSGTLLSRLHDPAPVDPAAVGLSIFAASSVSDEIREVMRRAVARCRSWDEVEVVATDPMTYGVAVDALARRLGIPVTYSVGLPVGRTRPGRAVDAYLRWLGADLPEDVLRSAIERGDMEPPPGGHRSHGPALARVLRRLRVGRGLERYRNALQRARENPRMLVPFDGDIPDDEYDEHLAAEQRVLEDLASLLEPVLDALPLLPDPVRGDGEGTSASEIANGLLAVLALVPEESESDRETKDLLRERLGRLAGTATRRTSFDAALATVAAKLDTRIGTRDAAGRSSWRARSGALHVSDIQTGGLSGRPVTFIVGLDAVRFPGAVQQDTLFGDDERRRLGRGAPFSPIPATAERLEERRWMLGELFSRLRGSITCSYAAWDAAEARSVAPASEMLQALRLLAGDATADYEQLHKALGKHVSAVPRDVPPIDAGDVWLANLSVDGVLLHGVDIVRGAAPGLDAGLRVEEVRHGSEFTAHHGRIAARPGLDPRREDGEVVSASRLEMLGTCPLRYLMRWVLGIRPLLDTGFRPDRWLTPLDRGSLLHRVYEMALKRQRALEVGVEDDAFETVAFEALRQELGRWRERLPPPGEATYAVEAAGLEEDVRAFVCMARETGTDWVALETRFGRRGALSETTGADPGVALPNEPVRIPLKDGVLKLSGRIDRIDRAPDGRLVVIDYKTGGLTGFGRRHKTYNRGRRLQHALYAEVVERLIGSVARAEYHFPTRRGETAVVSFDADALRWGTRIVNALLGLTARGWFYPTTDAADCRFCDYREVCRVQAGRETHSPLATWSASAVESLPELAVMRALLTEKE